MAFPDIRAKVRVNVGVAYDSDVSMVKNLLREIALSVSEVEREPQPEAFLVSFGDSALNMSLFFWVTDYNKTLAVTDQVNTTIITRFRESGIKIPYPTSVVLDKEK